MTDVTRLQAGDEDAWTQLFNDHSARVWNYVARMTGADSATVADVVQDIFVDVVRGLASFDPELGSMISWLLGIAHRKSALYWRQKSRPSHQHSLSESCSLLQSFTESECEVEQQEISDAVRSVISRLPDDAATVLVGFYLDGQSTAQLAQEWGVSSQAIRSRLSRARARFRELFEHQHSELVESEHQAVPTQPS